MRYYEHEERGKMTGYFALHDKCVHVMLSEIEGPGRGSADIWGGQHALIDTGEKVEEWKSCDCCGKLK